MIRIDYWNIHFPRLCNGSTSDSGSDCGGSNPPWGIKRADLRSAFLFMAPSNIGSVHRPLKAERRVRLPLELKIKIETKDTHLGCLFLFETEKRSRTAKRARRRGEKVPRMAPSASVDGPAGADTTSATRGLRLPLELKIKIETKDTHLGCLFFYSRQKNGVEPRSERAQ